MDIRDTQFRALRYTLDALVDAARTSAEKGDEESAKTALATAYFVASQFDLAEIRRRTGGHDGPRV